LPTSAEANQGLSAEQRFRAAFERLKLGAPDVLPKGTRVSQNNVAKEAGCDPSALRKARFPLLILEIQEWLTAHTDEQGVSERQKLIKQRRKNRDTKETLEDLKQQRDAAAGLLVDANYRILQLTDQLTRANARIDELRPSARTLNMPT
jgi:hypothetical protein